MKYGFTFHQITSFIVLLILSQCKISFGESVEKDLTLTLEQKVALDKFREITSSYVPHEYMKKDIYLIRWLRARDFDLQNAEEMLLNNLKWRKNNKMDTILQEDWSDMEEDRKYWINGNDIEGKPVAYFHIGDIDIRRIVLTGKLERLIRYADKYLEEITSKVRQLQDEGKNVTQYDFVVNLKGANLIQHGCLQCLVGLTRFITTYESYFPGAADKMFFVNAPAVVETVLRVVENAMSPLTRQALEIYGTNKNEWQPIVFSFIPRDQLPIEIGGTKIYENL